MGPRRIQIEITHAPFDNSMRPILDTASGYRDSFLQEVMNTPSGQPLPEPDPKLMQMEPWAAAVGFGNTDKEFDSVTLVKSLSDRYRFSVTPEALLHIIDELEYQESYCKELQWAGCSEDALMWSAQERSCRSNLKRIRASYNDNSPHYTEQGEPLPTTCPPSRHTY